MRGAARSQKAEYVLESRDEFERLERQSSLEQYDFRAELRGLKLGHGQKVLDAGCGSGLVSRFLASEFPWSQVVGCDASQERVDQARVAARGLANARFVRHDLTVGAPEPGSFDLAVCRFVLEHLDEQGARAAARALLESLVPGGEAWVIDIDGAFHNLHPQPPEIAAGLRLLGECLQVDLFVGRKLAGLLTGAGFTGVSARIETLLFQPGTPELANEREMIARRLEGARAFFEQLLGGAESFERFRDGYLDTLSRPDASLFYNKFIVRGLRPERQSPRSKRTFSSSAARHTGQNSG